ncbi:hypothetical protein ACQYWY_21650 [Comamonas sediminis]|uniref:hypothetical protein n=1 Tax=Comamonas sediminis TaxID=1783360 RepID=UPI003D2804E3
MLKRLQLYKPRASSLFNIMTDAISIDPELMTDDARVIQKKRKREPAEQELLDRLRAASLSDGAKTYLDKCAKELFYDYNPDKGSKHTEKGIEVEDQSIELLNSVFFSSYEKNTERRETDYLTGEPDIYTGSEIIDVKSSWSLDTFPASARAGDKKEYEWQMRAYMHLFSAEKATVAYCLVDTPDHLIGYEDEDLHIVSHKIPPELRITKVVYTRDMDLEKKLIERCKVAQEYVRAELFRIEAAHTGI